MHNIQAGLYRMHIRESTNTEAVNGEGHVYGGGELVYSLAGNCILVKELLLLRG